MGEIYLRENGLVKLILALLLAVLVGFASGTNIFPSVLAFSLFIVSALILPDRWILFMLIAWISFQNVALPILYDVLPTSSGIRLGLIATEVATYVYVLRRIASRTTLFRFEKWLFVYIAVIILYLPLSLHGNLFGLANSLRALLVPPMFYFAGRFSRISHNNFNMALYVLIGIQSISALFGLYVYFFEPHFWNAINIGGYWMGVKSTPLWEMVHGLPGNFYRFYTSSGIGIQLRLISLSGDPLATGYQALLSILVSMVAASRGRKILAVLSFCLAAIVIVLSFTRAALLGAVVGIGVFLSLTNRRRARAYWAGVIILIAVAITSMGKSVYTKLFLAQDGSGQGHVLALVHDWHLLLTHPLGSRIGGTDGLSSVAGHNVVGENTFAIVGIQIGVLGILALIFFIIGVYRQLLSYRSKEANFQVLRAFGLAVTTAFLITAMVSNELLTDTASGLFWMFLGLAIRQVQQFAVNSKSTQAGETSWGFRL